MSTNKEFNNVQLDVKFTRASTRENLVSEENISVSFGKISKYFADLHSQAFTGYTHPSHTSHPSGLYKITVDELGHVSDATAVTKADIPALDYLPNTTKYALSDSVGGSAKTADKLTTARTIAIGTGVTSTATSFDGSADITIPVTGLKEAYLAWGGKDFAQSYSPLDAALEPRLGANRLEMCPGSGIKIERTTDGGTTWTEVPTSSISNAQRSTLFSSSSGYTVPVSATSTAGMGTDAAKYMMRITLDTSVASVYTSLLKFILNVSTNGCASCYVKIRIRTAANVTAGNDTWLTWDKTNKAWSSSPTEANTKCPIGGWSGYNVINVGTFTTYGNNTSQYRNVQFIFGCSKNDSTSSGLSIINIQGYGGVAWNAPSNMARTGHLYSWNGTGAATFPSTVTATNFIGKLNGMTITGTADASYNLDNFLTEHPTIPTSTDTTSTPPALSDGGTFEAIDSVTRDSNGHVTKINTVTYTLPTHSFTDTKVDQTLSSADEKHPLLIANPQTSNTTATVNASAFRSNSIYATPSTGAITASKIYGSGTEGQSTAPTGGYHIYDCRNIAITPAHGDKSANFYFHMTGTPDTGKWWSILHMRGWTGEYAAWEIAGPAHNTDQSSTPLYVRTSNKNTAWGSWRKIYDSSNKPTASDLGFGTIVTHNEGDYVLKTGDTMTGDLTLAVSDNSNSPALIFRRGTLTDNYNDWKIYNSGGHLYFAISTANASTETWTNKVYINGSTNKLYVGSTAVSLEGHTHNYAGSSSAGGAATTIATTVTPGTSPTHTNYGLIFVEDPGTSGSNAARKSNDVRVLQLDGTVDTPGYARIVLGNATASGTAGNKNGQIALYTDLGGAHIIDTAASTATLTHTLPATTGTILNTGTTSFTRTLSSGTKIGTIKINGTSTDIYCETNTNTDTNVNVTLATTTKAYLLGTSTTPTATAQAVTSVADTGVYLGTTAGRLHATNFVGRLCTTTDAGTGSIVYGSRGLQWNDISTNSEAPLNDPSKICNPTADWYHHLIMNHTNNAGYYVDLAFCFHNNYFYYRRITQGTDHGWVRVLDSSNYTSYLTDTKVNVTLNTSTKSYLLATTTTPTSTAQAVESIGDTNIWIQSNAVHAAKYYGILGPKTNDTRPASANVSATGKYGMSLMIATSTMTTGKPMSDGFIINCDWDNTGAYGSQLFIPDTSNYQGNIRSMQWRAQSGSSDWSDAKCAWITLLDSQNYTNYCSKVSFTQNLSSGTKIGTITIDGTTTDLYCETNTNTDTRVNVTLATTTKAYLLGTSTTPTATAQSVTSLADTGVYLDTTAGGLCATNVKASSTVCANTGNSSTAGGISLYSTDPETYGIMFRGTSNSGKHGYVQSDWATYFTMNQGATTRGWIFRKKTDGPVASISGAGNAVFNGSVTVGGNSANTSGCRMEYNATTQSLDFVFV